ncbi:MAG: OmpH family outer membrane protein [Porphyromonas sp.]|nr:OmpH family outer membrane protein [Porphyromonas sp.]
MKRFLCVVALSIATTFGVCAQKFALVDMQYILKNIPDYEMMNEQLETISKKYQQEISKLENSAEAKYKKYQSDLVFLSVEQKKQREEEIVKIEQQASELQSKYFGPDGELFKKRTDMMKPIQDEIWETIKQIAKENNFQLVLDRGTSGIIFANPSIDISDLVLSKMGFAK